MSDEEELGRGKRAPQKTKAIEEFDKGVKKSQALRESNKRNKVIREEHAALDAGDAESAASSKEPKSKSKAKSKAKSGDDLEDERPPPIDEIAAELEEEEAEMTRLTHLIHFRDRVPYDKLGFWSLKELEAQWRKGDGAAPAKGANTTKAAGTSKAGATKATKSATATKTPKPKRIAGIVEPCQITMLGSPLLALQSAKKQSARAADMSPVVSRKRDASTDRSEPGSKRARMTVLDKIKPSKSGNSKSRLVSGPASFQRKGDLIVMPRSSSQAPSASRASSQVPVTSAPVATSGPALADSDIEMADLSDVEEVVEEPVKAKKKRAPKGEAKPRPTRGDYSGVELELQDQTFLILRARLGWDSACPESPEFSRMVRTCWAEAAPMIDTTTEEFPCTRDHIRVLSDRVTSYRGHCKKGIQTAAAIVYELDHMQGEMLTAHVDYLCEKVFYVGPKIDKRSGFYEHPFVSRALRIMYFLGNNPPALMAPGKFDPMPFNAIAVAMAITEFCIQSYRSGAFKSEEMSFDILRPKYLAHMQNLQVWQGCVPAKDVMFVRKMLYKAASTNSGHTAFIVAPTNPNLLTPADFQNAGDNESEDEPEDEPEDEFGLPLDQPKESSSKSKESSSKPSKPKKSSSKPSKTTESLGKSKGSSSKSKSASSKSKLASNEHTAASSNPAPPPDKPTTSRKPRPKGQGEVSVVLTTPAKPAKPTAPANSSQLGSSPTKSSPAKSSSSKPAPSKSGQTESANGGPGPDSSSSSDSSSGSDSDSDSNSDSDSGKSKPKPKTSSTTQAAVGGASKQDKSAHVKQSEDSSELSDDEDDVRALKRGGDDTGAGVDTGKGNGAKAQGEDKDQGDEEDKEEDEEDEDEGSKKGDKKKGNEKGNEEKDEESDVEKGGEEAANAAKPASRPTNNSSKQKSPVPESSSAPPIPTSPAANDPAAKEKEFEAKEKPKAKAKKQKKVSKGKEKDPAEAGSWQGIKTRRALAQSG
ncbi:hypothetical protein FRC12_001090 [Ceratobasidium sp. 428]|nr:hypothetical protein FRC12_001090 [Ceratobasidium sp. 428]